MKGWDSKLLLGIGIGLVLASGFFFSINQGFRGAGSSAKDQYESVLFDLKASSEGEELYDLEKEGLKEEVKEIRELEKEIDGEKDEKEGRERVKEKDNQDDFEFEISEGTNARELALNLYEVGFIKDVDAFLEELEEKDKTHMIRYGSYNISPSMEKDKLIEKITIDN